MVNDVMMCGQAPWYAAPSSELHRQIFAPFDLSQGGFLFLSADENATADLGLARPTAKLVQCLERRMVVITKVIIKWELLSYIFLDSLHHLLSFSPVVPKLLVTVGRILVYRGLSGGRALMMPPRSAGEANSPWGKVFC